ncbi:MAG: GNAT family N-acetyltransferase [Firmicutes bacterium]|nr:GNAT family N-acetyltransferase [Bacillota bacterium]
MRTINQQKLERDLKEMCQTWDFSGFFIVNQGDECLVESGFGYADRMVPNGLEQRAIESDSRFIFHSESPLLVAIAVLQLVDERKIKLTDSLSRWIPEYPFADQIKVKHLLKSNSGIPDFYYNCLMVTFEGDPVHQQRTDEEKRVFEKRMLNQNRHFERVFELVKEGALLYAPGTKGRMGSATNWVFLAEIVKRITGETVLERLMKSVFEPLQMTKIKRGGDGDTVSYTVVNNTHLVRMPLDYPVEGLFSVTLSDMKTFLKALATRKVFSEASWKLLLRYDEEGEGIVFENANGFDCANIEFLGYGFYFYINHKTGVSFASLTNEEQRYKHIAGDQQYFRRMTREIVEAAFTFPEDTKLVPLSTKNMWQALSLKVEENQQSFVLETKSSVAMALMYKTKRAFVEMEGSRAVGLLVLDINPKKNYFNIDIIIIDKRFQGKGYGKIMLNWAIETLKKQGAKELEIGVSRYNHAAKKIYMDAGFTPKAVYDGGMNLHMLIE